MVVIERGRGRNGLARGLTANEGRNWRNGRDGYAQGRRRDGRRSHGRGQKAWTGTVVVVVICKSLTIIIVIVIIGDLTSGTSVRDLH